MGEDTNQHGAPTAQEDSVAGTSLTMKGATKPLNIVGPTDTTPGTIETSAPRSARDTKHTPLTM